MRKKSEVPESLADLECKPAIRGKSPIFREEETERDICEREKGRFRFALGLRANEGATRVGICRRNIKVDSLIGWRPFGFVCSDIVCFLRNGLMVDGPFIVGLFVPSLCDLIKCHLA